MKRFGVTSAVLTCAALLTLSACGGEDAAPTTGSAPAASVAAPPAAASSAAAPAAGGGADDKKLCESVKKAGEDMKAELVTAMSSGEMPTPAVFQKILTGLEAKLTTLAAEGGDSELADALKRFGAEAAKAAKAADPATAADNPAFEKAGADITAACKPTGVNVNF